MGRLSKMTKDEKPEEHHEMVQIAPEQSNAGEEGNRAQGPPKDRFMVAVKQHITKLMSVLFLMLLGLAVATLEKQMNLRTDWEQGLDITQEHIARLKDFDDGVPDRIQSQASEIIEQWSMDSPPVVHQVRKRINHLNATMIIRAEWNKIGEEWYYHKFTAPKTYDNAIKSCEYRKGELATELLKTELTKDDIKGLSNSGAWVGYKKVNGTWTAADGSQLNNTLIQIDNGNENQEECGYVIGGDNGTLSLNGKLCNESMSYVCEAYLNYAY